MLWLPFGGEAPLKQTLEAFGGTSRVLDRVASSLQKNCVGQKTLHCVTQIRVLRLVLRGGAVVL